MNRIRINVLATSGRGRAASLNRVPEPQSCAHTSRPCSLARLDGYEYCLKHILDDRAAPYRQCCYVSARNSKRCPNAAPRNERKDSSSLCAEHARKASKAARQQMRKQSSGITTESILADLGSYMLEDGRARTTKHSDASRLLDDSCSESEGERMQVDHNWRGDPDSEAESVDSDQEDPLKHAEVYTAEEVALITREKLIRLQSLYIDQFKRMQHLLKEKRRRYLHCRRSEDDPTTGIAVGVEGIQEQEDLRRLRAMKRYRRRFGVEALLHRQLKDRRTMLSDPHTLPQLPSHRGAQRCMGTVDGVRCSNRILPLSKHCAAHICQDSAQLLFRMCPGVEGAPCNRPVPVSLSDNPHCPLHTPLPPSVSEQSLELSEDCSKHIDVVGEDPAQSSQLQGVEGGSMEWSGEQKDGAGNTAVCPSHGKEPHVSPSPTVSSLN
ncbi:KAT8 regulatory NSL complex subunit 2 isoform X1 [Lethenteron reissneri]|uniref:KAT8 regulatory NSL complex subunit 2 isoform X1 n=1 Tax=Lethenteron reissneri TaxID=7753 RepID=UPI002AB75BB1|nr:KAT8 regulatory NSL complex subunit 2 isoform X1 [Lethenteron reissneri]